LFGFGKMTDRAQKLMDAIWQERNTWADTEQKLVAAIIRKTMEHVRTMTAQKMNNLTVLDKGDMMTLSKEVENLP
jgi:response regulator of citrate/malate metabolism